MYHCATKDSNVHLSARKVKSPHIVLHNQTLSHALPKKSYTWAQPVLTINTALPSVLRWWFVYWSKYCTIHLMMGFIPVNNIPGILLTPGILNAYKTHTHTTQQLLAWISKHTQPILKLCSIFRCVKRNCEVLMPSKHSEDIQTESRSFLQVKSPFNSLTCQEKTGKLQRQKNPMYFKEKSVATI